MAPFAGLLPSPLSVVAPTREPLPAAAGESTIAVRVPAHPQLRDLLLALGRPLTATSANRSGEPPILDPRDLEPLLATADAMVVDGGVLAGGPPSTLVELRGGTLHVLRPGAFEIAQLRRIFSAAAVESLGNVLLRRRFVVFRFA